ncbi:MAG: rod shape-determining protein [Candidatus Aminicenantes bacterium]|nr:MAG: rod shape-determining protein [Candidatus Aminicenantes bacterium]
MRLLEESVENMIFAGIDAGSRAIKVQLIDENNRTLASGLGEQGVKQADLATQLLEQTSAKIGINRDDITKVVATGYGRDSLEFVDTAITEITCHARGVIHQISEAKTIIDIGGQDSKLIRLEGQGVVQDFVMNERCAAGTGNFLEVVARQLEMDILDLGKYAEKADKPAVISSMCVVFAETEILGLLTSGESRENIIAGVQASIATRIASMGGRQIADPVIFTGGVALIPGMTSVLENTIGHSVVVAKDPQFTGAKGAAIMASELN